MYDKDWEVWLALNNPEDPIHAIIEKQLDRERQTDKTDGQNREVSSSHIHG